MRIAGVVFADFAEANLGGPSHLRTVLAGQTIIGRTLRRMARVAGLAARCLFVRPRDRALGEQALRDAGLEGTFELLATDSGFRGRRELIRAARKWSLEAWRGNPLGLTWFDEFIEPAAVAVVLSHYQCDALLCCDGHQPVCDPDLHSAMLRTLHERREETGWCFTQAPPGLAGVIVGRDMLADLLQLEIPLGLLLSYRPELAQVDPITSPACHHVAPEIMQTAARLTGDTRRSRELLEEALRELGDEASASDLCAWVRRPGHDRAGPLPVEVEIELTTDDPLPDTTLRPRGTRVPQRVLRDLDAVRRVADELATYDDRLVVLGGHGDPLRHSEFAEVCRILRAAGVFGVAVVTPLIELSDGQFEALFEQRVDIVEVLLDAHSRATYAKVQGADRYDQVVANLERLEQTRVDRRVPQPIVVPSQTRCAATLADLEAFHDDWIRRVGSAVIRGFNDYCGVMPADPLLPTWPPVRVPCRRLGSRLMLLADGSIPLCGQDLGGERLLGGWLSGSLRDTWEGAGLADVRAAHAALSLGTLPACGHCTEWNRP